MKVGRTGKNSKPCSVMQAAMISWMRVAAASASSRLPGSISAVICSITPSGCSATASGTFSGWLQPGTAASARAASAAARAVRWAALMGSPPTSRPTRRARRGGRPRTPAVRRCGPARRCRDSRPRPRSPSPRWPGRSPPVPARPGPPRRLDRLLVLGLDVASDAGVADLVAAGDVRDGHGDLLRLQLSQLLGDAGLDGVVLGLAQGEVDPVAVRGVEAVPEFVDQVLRVDELREVGVAGGRYARAPAGQGLADAGVLLDVGPHLVDGRVELGELLGDRGAAVAEQFTELNAAINQMWTDVEEDPRVGEALTGWGSCMATAGYPDLAQLVDAENLVNELWNRFNAANGNRIDLSLGETEYDAVKASIPEELAELQAKEIAVAVADVTCRDEVGYTRIRRDVETEYEQAIVDTYRADLEAWVDAVHAAEEATR